MLLVPCSPLPEVEDGRLSSLIENHVATAHLYHDCAARHRSLAAAVRVQQGLQVSAPATSTSVLPDEKGLGYEHLHY